MSSPGAGVDRSIWHVDASGNVTASGTIDDRAAFEEMQGQSYGFDPATQTIWVRHHRDSGLTRGRPGDGAILTRR